MDLYGEIPEVDLSQIYHESTEIQWRDPMNQDSPIHWVLFLSCDVFMNIFPLQLFIFIWNTINYFFIEK